MKTWIHTTLILLGVGTVVAATRVLDVRWRASHVRSASTSLKTLSSTDLGFRANDRDWSHVNDFWETNLSGLAALSAEQKAIKLIEISVAAADRPGILEEFVQGTKFWLDHRRTADCPHDAMERFQGKCDGGLRMYWSKGLD